MARPGRAAAVAIVAFGSVAALSIAPAGGAPAGLRDAASLPARPIDAKLERLEGGRLRLSELRGRPVLLDLWATWCLPCRDQARIVHEAADELTARSVEVLAVNQGEREKLVREFVAANPSRFPVVLDPLQTLGARLDVGELPALVLLDRDGRVVAVREGLTKRPELLALLEEGDGGGPAAPGPRTE